MRHKTPVEYDLEKYQHEIDGLEGLLGVMGREHSDYDILEWVLARMKNTQQNIDTCKRIIEEREKDDEKLTI